MRRLRVVEVEAAPLSQQTSFRVKERLELMHRDLCGPMTPATPGGRCYFLLLIDDLLKDI
jgi:hypothetical protein